jgi:hypothetical protein
MELVFHNADSAKLLHDQIIKDELIHLDGTRVKGHASMRFCARLMVD